MNASNELKSLVEAHEAAVNLIATAESQIAGAKAEKARIAGEIAAQLPEGAQLKVRGRKMTVSKNAQGYYLRVLSEKQDPSTIEID